MGYADYVCYLLGCQSAGIVPLEVWDFRVLQAEFLRRAAEPDAPPSDIPVLVLEQLALVVAEGYEIAASGGTLSPRNDTSSKNDEPPGSAACGVREPRVPPREPVLAGSAARPLPLSTAPDLSFWRV